MGYLILGYFLSPLCTVCYCRHVEFGAKFDFFDRFVIDLQRLCLTSRVTHSLLHFWMILEASGAEKQ